MLDLFQCPDNGAIGQTGQNVAPHVAKVIGNAPGIVTIQSLSTSEPNAKVVFPFRKTVAIKHVMLVKSMAMLKRPQLRIKVPMYILIVIYI